MGISLEKGSRISLTKEAGGSLNQIMLGLGWDPVRGWLRGDADLDANAITFDADGTQLDVAFYQHLDAHDGAIHYQGDNVTGSGAGDDEQILVTLNDLPNHVQHVVFTIASYGGHKFNRVENAFVRVVNQADGNELCRYNLSDKYKATGMVMGRLYREASEWKFAAIGEPADGRTYKDQIRAVQGQLS